MCRSARLFFSTVFLFACFLILTAVSPVYADWEFQDSGVDSIVILLDVCFIDEFHGWVVGNGSTIITTMDGGETWLKQECPVPHLAIEKVQFLNENVGYCCGTGFFFSTRDGGETWTEVNLGFRPRSTLDISFADENTGWVTTEYHVMGTGFIDNILFTDDGGITWEKQITVPYTLWSIDCIDKNMAWATGSYADTFARTHVFRTVDGGKNWVEYSSLLGMRRHLKAVSSDTVWVWMNGINVSHDSGLTWSEGRKGSPPVTTTLDVAVIDYRNAYVWCFLEGESWGVGDYALRYTDDGCKTFRDIMTISNESFAGWNIAGIGREHVWVVGSNGMILKYTESTTGISDLYANIPDIIQLKQNYPNPFNPITTITYSIVESSNVKLVIYSVSGQKVATLVDGHMAAGKHTATFDGSNLTSGVYFYRFESKGITKTGKMLLIK